MKGRFKFTREEDIQENNRMYGVDYGYVSRPLKSPSPDKKSANIITSTKSPEISQIKRNSTPVKEQYSSIKQIQKSQLKQKHFQVINTPNRTANYKNLDTGASSRKYQQKQSSVPEYKITSSPGTKSRNIKIEIAADNPTEDFQIRHSSSRYRSEFRGELSELDYLKILKSKEEHIHELKDLLENYQNNTNNRRNQIDQSTIRNLQNKINNLNAQIKELQVENQYLLSALEKNKPNMNSNKEEILQRQIRQLRESLRDKQFQIQEITNNFNKKHQKDKLQIKIIQKENQSLVQLLKEKKEKNDNQRSKEDLSNSALSLQQSHLSRSSQKDRLSLVKIKEIHQQNIKIAQQTFYNQIKLVEQGFFAQIQQLQNKVQQLNDKLIQLQAYKRQAENKLSQKDKNQAIREQHHKQKQRHQQIQGVLLQKYSYYQNQLQDQKRQNQKLTYQLNQAQQDIQQLHLKELTYSRDTNGENSLKRQNEDLTETVKILQNQLDKNSKATNKIINEKDQQIKILQNKVQLLIDQYQSKIKIYKNQHQQKIASLQSQVRTLKFRSQEFAQAHEREKTEIQRQLKDALKLYDKENSGLKQSLLQKNNEIVGLNEQNQKLKSELLRLSQQQKDYTQVAALQSQNERLRYLHQVVQQNHQITNQQLQQAKDKLGSQVKQKEKLNHLLSQSQDQNASLRDNLLKAQQIYKINQSLQHYIRNLQNQNKQLQKALSQLSEKLVNTQQTHKQLINNIHSQLQHADQQNNTLRNKVRNSQQIIREKQHQYEQLRLLLDSIKTQRSTLRYETIEEELKQLKLLISEYYSKNKNRLDNQIVEQFFRLNHAHQIKIDQNYKLLKEIQNLKIELSNQTKEKLILNEKISLLQNNIAIYERQMRERRQLYDQVLQQKIRIEKEILLSKKIKAEQSSLVQSFKTNTTEITSKIDRLVEFERERYRQIKNLVNEEYSSLK